jgi:GxxExxY protein
MMPSSGSPTASNNPTGRFLHEDKINRRWTQMNADYPYKEEADAIIGSAFAVMNDLGHGYHEKPYENSLVIEFEYRGIPFLQQPRFPIFYREKQVSEFIPDLIAFNKVIVDTKVIERITDHEIGQMLNYLKVTGLPVGLILNFKNAKLEFRRVISTHQKFIRRNRD